MHSLVSRRYPICRSITGEGLRETLREIQRHIPIVLHEVPTGTPALDWKVPAEWNVRSARIETLDGKVVVDFDACNLHVVSYSAPIDAVISRKELAGHVHTLPDQPDLVPYRTAYYDEQWGFCLAHGVWESMRDAQYRIRIDSSLGPGTLTYGELFVSGKERDEVLISVHCCHPSLANDNLSGIAVATEIARQLNGRSNRLSYRFLFIPTTIGSLTWLSRNEEILPHVAHGLVLACIGDKGSFHYKQSRRGDATIDAVVAHVFKARNVPHMILPFSAWGYDERQYCSPAYNLPVGCFMRSPNGTFPEYHTSADNLDFVTAEALDQSLELLLEVIDVLERNIVYERIDGRGEPQLGRRGLYRAIGAQKDHAAAQMALLWLLNQADGTNSLVDIAKRSGASFENLAVAAELALSVGLIRRTSHTQPDRPLRGDPIGTTTLFRPDNKPLHTLPRPQESITTTIPRSFSMVSQLSFFSLPAAQPSGVKVTVHAPPPVIERLAPGVKRPFWSVMIPVFNAREDYLRETLASVLQQDPGSEKMQIEVIDNCSTSFDPEPLVRELGGGRIAFHRQPENGGIVGSSNACIRRARGQWIHILHADDTVRPDFYKHALAGIEAHPGVGAALCQLIYMDEKGHWTGMGELEAQSPGLLDAGFATRQFIEQRIQFAQIVVRRSTYEELGGFRSTDEMDWDMWKRLALSKQIYYDPAPLACFRIHSASYGGQLVLTGKNVVDERESIEYSCAGLPAEQAFRLRRAARKAAGIRATRRARLLWKGGQRAAAWRQLFEATRCSLAPAILLRAGYFMLYVASGAGKGTTSV